MPQQDLPYKESSSIPLLAAKPFQPSLRYPSNRKSIYDRNLSRPSATVALSSFAYLFHSLITYHHQKSGSVSEIEARLNRAGYPIGIKILELLLWRQSPRNAVRPIRLLDLLQFIHGTLWRALFGRPADALEQSTTKKEEYMIIDNEPLVNTYISIPKEMSQLNCAAIIAGVIEGVCDAAAFTTESVTAHWAGEGNEMWPGKTIFLLRFSTIVLEREDAVKAGAG